MLSAEQAQRFAIIDLGSNTARLVVLHAVPGFAFKLEDEIREVVRLREGMRDGRLSPAAMTRAFFTLQMFKRFCDNYPVDQIIATATSAVRDAQNGSELLSRISREIGLDLQILSGEEEAYIGALGALNEQPLTNGYVLDIGGGSAQISKIRHHRFVEGVARPLGALALTELYVNSDPPPADCFNTCQAFIQSELDAIPWLQKNKRKPHRRLVGLGGTIRNLASIQAKRDAYPLNTLHGFFLSKSSVEKTIDLLRRLSLPERRAIPGLNPDRADIILPGAMVLHEVMTRLRVTGMTVSVNGLREGLFFQRFWDHLAYPVVTDVRRFSVLNMARVYDYQKNHASHVRFLANRLFNQLQPLHNCTPADRELLEAAAVLHDLGSIISYNDHHKHSQTLIINSGLPGYTPRETALIALLTRYHRKGKPSIAEFSSILEDDDQERLTKMTALLRLAEFLERGRNANVDDVAAVWDAKTLRITLVADQYPAVELWEAERNAVSLMETAFQREIILESTAVPTTTW
jgi:exopolyphosphatase/guanosine-5'-triphosphate,3'-diphosphate pyrophosphatase